MRAALAFLSGLVLGAIFRPLRIDPRRRPPMVQPYRGYRYRPPLYGGTGDVRLCQVCGSQIPEGRPFCTSCGASPREES